MTIFQRHKKTTILLAIHLMWWLFMAYFFWIKITANHINGPHCDFSPIIFFNSIPIAIGVSLILLGKHIDSKNNSNDYLLFAGLLLFPLIIAAGIYSFPVTDKKTQQILHNSTIKLALNTCNSQAKKEHPTILYKKANHKLGYWISKK